MRALRPLCQAGVALWIALGLSRLEALRPQESVVPEPRRVAVEPRPAAPPVRARPAPRPVGAGEIEAGMKLLAAGGSFPALTCGYQDFGSFARYARAMESLGARFVVVADRRIRGRIDLEEGRLEPDAASPRFSPRARDYSGEPALAPLARRARERFGPGAEVMMLVPRELDAGLFGGIARALAEDGESAEGYRELRGSYREDPAGGVRLELEEGVRLDGSLRPLALVFDLGRIGATARSSPADA